MQSSYCDTRLLRSEAVWSGGLTAAFFRTACIQNFICLPDCPLAKPFWRLSLTGLFSRRKNLNFYTTLGDPDRTCHIITLYFHDEDIMQFECRPNAMLHTGPRPCTILIDCREAYLTGQDAWISEIFRWARAETSYLLNNFTYRFQEFLPSLLPPNFVKRIMRPEQS